MNIAQEIMRVLGEFNISSKIIALMTNNDSAMIVCRKEMSSAFNDKISSMNFKYYHCTAHILNLRVKEGLKYVSNSVTKACKIMIMIKNSTCLCDLFRTFCSVKNIK